MIIRCENTSKVQNIILPTSSCIPFTSILFMNVIERNMFCNVIYYPSFPTIAGFLDGFSKWSFNEMKIHLQGRYSVLSTLLLYFAILFI